MPNKFQAPSHTEELLDSVADRCQNLIVSNVWDIKKSKLKSWINNFKSNNEKYLCALLLDAFMYRSDSMIESLCQHAVCSILYNSCVNKSIGSIEDWAYSFQQGKAKDFAFVAVEGIKNGERESGKSGQLVIRQYDRSGTVSKRLFIDASNLLEKIQGDTLVKTIVFMDDFCGTGTQFNKFYDYYDLKKLPPEVDQYYIPFAAHSDCLNTFNSDHLAHINIQAVELLREDQFFFREVNGTFRGDGLNSLETAKDFYLSVLEANNIKLKEPFGYGSLATTYAFSFSTPNNMLPIFWTRSGKWMPLVER